MFKRQSDSVSQEERVRGMDGGDGILTQFYKKQQQQNVENVPLYRL